MNKPFVSPSTLFQRIINFRILLTLFIFSFALLTYFAKTSPYFIFDLNISLFIQSIDSPKFDSFMKFITALGNFEWAITTTILFTLIAFYYQKKVEAFMIIISPLITFIISIFFKAIVSRPRPDPSLINQIETYLYSDSFPSGHVLYYIGLYGLLFFLVYTEVKHSLIRTFLLAIFLTIIIFGGISRIYLGAHWFSDILGSYLIGTVWLYLLIHFYQNRLKATL